MMFNRWIFKILLCTMLVTSVTCLGYGDELIADFEEDSVPVLNEELRKIRDDISGITNTKTIVWYLSGGQTIGTTKSAKIYIPFDAEIVEAHAYIITAPTGSSFIVDININGTTIFSGDKLVVSASADEGSTTTIGTTDIADGDYIDIDIDQVGSTIPGSDLTVQLEITT